MLSGLQSFMPDGTHLVPRVISNPQADDHQLAIGFLLPFALHAQKPATGTTQTPVEPNPGRAFETLKESLDDGWPKAQSECHLILPDTPTGAHPASTVHVSIGAWQNLEPGSVNHTPECHEQQPDQHGKVRYLCSQAPWEPGVSIRIDTQTDTLQACVPDDLLRLVVLQTKQGTAPLVHELGTLLETLCLIPDQHLGIGIYRTLMPVSDAQGSDIIAIKAILEKPGEHAVPLEEHTRNLMAELGHHLTHKLGQNVPTLPDPHTLSQLSEQELMDQVAAQRTALGNTLDTLGLTEDGLLDLIEKYSGSSGAAATVRHTSGSFSRLIAQIEDLVNEAMNQDSPKDVMALRAEAPVQAPAKPAPAVKENTAHRTPAAHTNEQHREPAGRTTPAGSTPARPKAMRQQVQEASSLKQSCENLNLAGANLAGLDLTTMNFSGANLQNANLAGANLTGADLTGANLEHANLDGTNLQDARLEHAMLDHASLLGACLRSCNLSHSTARHAVFADADLTESCLDHTRLDHASLERAQLGAASLVATVLEHANLDEADLTCARLSGSMANALTTLRRARLDGAVLDEIRWAGCQLDNATLCGVTATGAYLAQARLTAAVLMGSDLRNAVFDHAHMERVNLNQCDLSATRLRGAHLVNGWLLNCRLHDTDLTNANLTQARLPDHEHNTPAPTTVNQHAS